MSKHNTAVLLIGYGGPEKPEDVIPFLKNVARGFSIPEDRLKEVAHHYELIGGRSPLNELTEKQAKKLERFLSENGHEIPIFIGMRNWHPFISDSVKKIADLGVSRAIGVIMALHQCDASWEKYQRDVSEAVAGAGAEIEFVYTCPLFNNPLFIESSANQIRKCFENISDEELESTKLIFTAHSIPVKMAEVSPYISQFERSARSVAENLRHKNWMIAYQSRSGSPSVPWLEPDVCDIIEELGNKGIRNIVVQAIGFVCDHVEVLYDIGIEARETAEKAGVKLHIAKTVNDDDLFIKAIRDEVVKHILHQ